MAKRSLEGVTVEYPDGMDTQQLARILEDLAEIARSIKPEPQKKGPQAPLNLGVGAKKKKDPGPP